MTDNISAVQDGLHAAKVIHPDMSGVVEEANKCIDYLVDQVKKEMKIANVYEENHRDNKQMIINLQAKLEEALKDKEIYRMVVEHLIENA